MDRKEDKKPIPNTKEEYVKIPKVYLDILKEQNERLIKEFSEEQRNHENEVKRFEKIITRFIIMNGIIMALWFIFNWIATIFLKWKWVKNMPNWLRAILKTMLPWFTRLTNRVKSLGKAKDKNENKGGKC